MIAFLDGEVVDKGVGRCCHRRDEPQLVRAVAAADDGEAASGDARVHAEDGALEHLFAAV